MLKGDRVVAVVPARAGSKGIVGKNLAKVGGRSLVRRAVETGLAVEAVDRVIVSTDGEEIAAEARAVGAEVDERPRHLAGDTALIWDMLVDLTERLRADGEACDILVLLEPTACLRQAHDVAACLDRLAEGALDSCATFTTAEPHPHRAWRIEGGRPRTFIEGAVPWMPRQTLPEAYRLNGVAYVLRADGLFQYDPPGILFGAMGAVVMDAERSIDIDDATDLEVANAIDERLQGRG